jgi:hypothetical protein
MFTHVASLLLAMGQPCGQAESELSQSLSVIILRDLPVLMDITDGTRTFAGIKQRLIWFGW